MMINLCVIHNNEAPRLEYLRAQIRGLAKAIETDGISLRLYDVGPEASGMAGQVPQDSFLNRLKRAWAAAWLFAGYARHDPRRRTDRLRYARLWFRHFKSILFDYLRSIRIEQEVLYAHGHAWKIASRTALPTIVLESDAIFPEGAIENLVSLIKWSLPQLEQEYFFADLAGGCSTQEILNSWCFEERFGMRTMQVGAIDIQILPSLTANTVGGYLMSASLAAEFCRLLQTTKRMVPPDWAVNLFAMHEPAVAKATCVHTNPTILRQGSADGTYGSTISERS
ncbi:MAG: hypothetical protein J0G37_03835 [Afipia sp.]|nr:hypothetical protein [Afipia sp.]